MTFLAALVALRTCIKGMDASVISSGSLFYSEDLHLAAYKKIHFATLEELISSASSAGAIGCEPLLCDPIDLTPRGKRLKHRKAGLPFP